MKKKNRIATVFLLIFLSVVSIIVLFPFYALTIAAFKPTADLMRYGVDLRLELSSLSLDNFRTLFSSRSGDLYFHWYKNSIIVTFFYTFFSLLFSSLVGYGFGVYNFKGKNILFVLVLVVMMTPTEILILPLYKMMINMGLINTFTGVIAPFAISPIAIFFFRQFASGLPKELMDAGRIDGCSEYGLYFRIMMPLMLPAFGAMAILQGMRSWNDLLWPLIVLRTEENFTLPIGLSALISPYEDNLDILISGSIMTVVPMIILFLFFQRYFVAGLTAGGVKG
ncbi:carbohydrate ABC transporter permease [Halalkalibacter alkaliphilus]|uniref:Carbohydrate ABC transporter permease n=1 Tax=Halalkalibacter alkaliphilus TaxID=2917993 RepID=A0A9X2CXN3_9BACI|nr:carbohydrate ABC transporter permease [Halalkalibacter alkaliphilus]MCL7749927.1 carbohydrate ABC transporter permease [Halalkalibacter alkaliphilus]